MLAWPLALAACATPPAPAPETLEPRIAAVTAAAAAHGFAGQVLVADRVAVVHDQAIGLADPARGLAHRTDEAWRWASVSKQVAAALVMQQVDAGRLALDDPLGRPLPELAATAPGSVTIRQLLQHTSGLPNPDDTPPDARGVPGFYTQAGTAPGYCTGTPKGPPGVRFDYNNCDTLLLGRVLERLDDAPFAEIVQRRVAGPLQLSTLRLGSSARPLVAVGLDAKGVAVPVPRIETFGASAALEGTADDLLAFDRALLAQTLVSAPSTAAMWAGDPKLGYVALGAWSFSAPLRGCAQPVALVERRGDVAGIQVRNILAPRSGQVVIVFTNSADFEFGEIWQGAGFTYELLSAALCPAA